MHLVLLGQSDQSSQFAGGALKGARVCVNPGRYIAVRTLFKQIMYANSNGTRIAVFVLQASNANWNPSVYAQNPQAVWSATFFPLAVIIAVAAVIIAYQSIRSPYMQLN